MHYLNILDMASHKATISHNQHHQHYIFSQGSKKSLRVSHRLQDTFPAHRQHSGIAVRYRYYTPEPLELCTASTRSSLLQLPAHRSTPLWATSSLIPTQANGRFLCLTAHCLSDAKHYTSLLCVTTHMLRSVSFSSWVHADNGTSVFKLTASPLYHTPQGAHTVWGTV